jgi:aminoglycoside phosphotransferase family enzyme
MCSPHTTASISNDDATVGLYEKIEFLSAAENFPDRATRIEVMQTHHACLFFTDHLVYKMKKPIRYGRIDYGSLTSRRHACEEELRLNRRLAAKTYLRIVPLVSDRRGRLVLDGDGDVVEWLIEMRRLPRSHILDVAARRGLVSRRGIDNLMRKLLRFYGRAPVLHAAEGVYPGRLSARVTELRDELLRPEFQLVPGAVDDVIRKLRNYIDCNPVDLERRQEEGHIREIHGDLRPEHVCLQPPEDPQIIDCLEFDVELRQLDCMEELAFFGMECRHMGQAWIEERCMEHYREQSGDTSGDASLWSFYAALRATTRAMHSVWHLHDSDDVGKWTDQAKSYLEEAQYYLASGVAPR